MGSARGRRMMGECKRQASDGEEQETDRRIMGKSERQASDGEEQVIEKSERQAGE